MYVTDAYLPFVLRCHGNPEVGELLFSRVQNNVLLSVILRYVRCLQHVVRIYVGLVSENDLFETHTSEPEEELKVEYAK